MITCASLTLDVLAPQLLHDLWWEYPGSKGTAEYGVELSVQASNAHLAKVPIWVDDGLPDHLG